MHPDTKLIATHMKEFGLYTLGRAVYDATFAEIMKPFAHSISVTLAAHAGEILVKARIAQQHPLLIFKSLPKSSGTSELLDIEQLLVRGQTVGYPDLPELLWATTGYRIPNSAKFIEFGKLRNTIAHFAVPDGDLSDETLLYALGVIDPMVGHFWDDTLIPYAETWDDVIVQDGYLQERLKHLTLAIDNPLTKAALEQEPH